MGKKPVIKIDVEGISKKFGSRTLFSDVSCHLSAGDCLIITGRNGSGKSTLIKILAKLLRPTSGTVTFVHEEQECQNWEDCQPHIGFVSPEVMFYDNLTGQENLEFVVRARGMRLLPIQMEEILTRVGLGSRGGQLVKTYSTGMKQRLKFAVVLALEPIIWFVDEGLSNLDADGRDLGLDLMKQALEKGCLLVMATNDLLEAGYATQTIALS